MAQRTPFKGNHGQNQQQRRNLGWYATGQVRGFCSGCRLCTSNEGIFLKFYLMNISDSFKSLLFFLDTFGVRRTIDVLDPETSPDPEPGNWMFINHKTFVILSFLVGILGGFFYIAHRINSPKSKVIDTWKDSLCGRRGTSHIKSFIIEVPCLLR